MSKYSDAERLSNAKKEYEKLQRLIAPYIKKPIVEDVVDPRIWFESGKASALRGRSVKGQAE